MASQANGSGAEERQAAVHATYRASQTLRQPVRGATREELCARAENWKDPAIPALQRSVVRVQLENLERGVVDPVFASLAKALARVDLREFTLLDAACASGYYRKVIAKLDPRPIHYSGCDYSPAMVAAARENDPETQFEVQDLTRLGYGDRQFDVVLLSGVLEHVPRFEAAIAEACRVARACVVVHRAPLRRLGRDRLTLGTQYNIETPRIYFGRRGFLRAFRSHHFRPIWEGDTYEPRGALARVKSRLKSEVIHTLVFERAE